MSVDVTLPANIGQGARESSFRSALFKAQDPWLAEIYRCGEILFSRIVGLRSPKQNVLASNTFVDLVLSSVMIGDGVEDMLYPFHHLQVCKTRGETKSQLYLVVKRQLELFR